MTSVVFDSKLFTGLYFKFLFVIMNNENFTILQCYYYYCYKLLAVFLLITEI